MHHLEILWYLAIVFTAFISAAAASREIQVHPVYKMTENMYPVTISCKSTCGLIAVVGGFLTSCIIYHFGCRAYCMKNVWQPINEV